MTQSVIKEEKSSYQRPEDIFARIPLIISQPIARFLMKYDFFTPNRVTLASQLVGVLAAISFIFNDQNDWDTYIFAVLGALLFLTSFVLDQIDGEIARGKKLTSNYGCWFDSLGDLTIVKLLIIGIAAGTTEWMGHDVTEIRWIIACFAVLSSTLLDYDALLSYFLTFDHENPKSNVQDVSGLPLWLVIFFSLINQLFTFIVLAAIAMTLFFFLEFFTKKSYFEKKKKK